LILGWHNSPIPVDAELTVSEASEELTLLGKRFFTATTMRGLFPAHLLAQWPSGSAPALKSLLGSLNYIKGPCD